MEQCFNNGSQDKPCHNCRLIEIGEAACYFGKCGVCGRPSPRRWKIYMSPKTDVVVVAKKYIAFDKSILFTHKYIRVYSLKFTIDYVSIIK